MQIREEWKNAKGERVVITETGHMHILNERGQPVERLARKVAAKTAPRTVVQNAPAQKLTELPRMAVNNVMRYDVAAKTAPRTAAQNANAEEVIELPLMAIKPYYETQQTEKAQPKPAHNVAARDVTELPFMAIKPYYETQA